MIHGQDYTSNFMMAPQSNINARRPSTTLNNNKKRGGMSKQVTSADKNDASWLAISGNNNEESTMMS
jgi:hypothetical protein